MNIKASVKHRREARIKELLEGKQQGSSSEGTVWPALPDRSSTVPSNTSSDLRYSRTNVPLSGTNRSDNPEPDPERMWKEGHRGWYDSLTPGGPEEPPKRALFLSGLIRRVGVSAVVFGLVWGVFAFQHPWAIRTQAFVVQSLSHEMDFQAAQVWYEEHFGSAPSFIPIFGQTDDPSTKVNASRSLVSPIEGKLVQSFAVDLKGIVLEPSGGSLSDRAVKSIETGRVLEVSQHADGITLLIQHTGERTAVYSRLAETTLKVNDWVQGGDIIGSLPPSSNGSTSSLYFELKEGNREVDPVDVIPFD